MSKKLRFYLLALMCFSLLISCKSDDEYTPIAIDLEADFVEVFQNVSIDIDVLANDEGIPNAGLLLVADSPNANLVIIDNSTPNNLEDDLVRYEPDGIFVGEETIAYTICDGSGDNCVSSTIMIKVLPVSPVAFDLASMPYPKLSDYNFYKGDMSNLEPVFGLVPYEPINSLFSDYAHKKRFIWMPSGVRASFNEDYKPLDFPEGTLLVKNFFYDNVLPANSRRIIETRVMIRRDSNWVFASYVWNEEQSEALFDLNGSFTNVQWLENGEPKEVNYRIPSEPECFTCHKDLTESTSIGLKPQNLNKDYLYKDGNENQLQKLIDVRYLEDNIPTQINTVGNWKDESLSLENRVRSYVDINCAHCHSEWGHCDYRPLRLAYFQNDDVSNMGVCIPADTQLFINNTLLETLIEPQEPEESIVFFRITSTAEEYRMPLLGRTINHDEGISLVEAWINSLDSGCN